MTFPEEYRLCACGDCRLMILKLRSSYHSTTSLVWCLNAYAGVNQSLRLCRVFDRFHRFRWMTLRRISGCRTVASRKITARRMNAGDRLSQGRISDSVKYCRRLVTCVALFAHD